MTLFETNPREALERLKGGQDFWLPTRAVENRALEVFAENAPKIRAAFGDASLFDNYNGLDTATLDALLEDYARVLLGVFTPLATPAQLKILEVLEKEPQLNDLFKIDRWGLGVATLVTYLEVRRGLKLYEAAKASKEAAAEYIWPERRSAEQNQTIALTTRYQVEQAGLFDYSFFIDAVGGEKVRHFIAKTSTFANLFAFSTYYGVWKYSLGKPSTKPRTPESLAAFAGLAEQVEENCKAVEKSITDWLDAGKTETRYVKLSTQNARLGTLINQIQARPLEYTTNLAERLSSNKVEVKDTKDLQPIIAMVQKRVESGKILPQNAPSPLVINQALCGVNMLLSVHNPRLLNGLYTIETRPSEFIALCGVNPTDTTGSGSSSIYSPQRAQLFAALEVINEIYIAVFSPKAVTAVKVLTIRKFEQPKKGGQGMLTIDIPEEVVTEKEGVLYDEYLSWRKAIPGAAGFRFIHQLLTKSHIKESELLDQVFANSYKVKEAALGFRKAQTRKRKGEEPAEDAPKLTPEQEAARIQAIQKTNIAKQRKELEGYFKTAKAIGLILWYKRTKARAAGSKEYVYSWSRHDTPEEYEAKVKAKAKKANAAKKKKASKKAGKK